jgi:hypothetical protein
MAGLMAGLLLLAAASAFCGCACDEAGTGERGSTQATLPTVARDPLVPGEPFEVDLDADGDMEQVLLDPAGHTLLIDDGPDSYRTRDRWQVIQAALADLDRNGLTEVVALLDSQTGRHIGLFAFFGGTYRERLVGRPVDPAPVSFKVVTDEDGDLLELTLPPLDDSRPSQTVLLRWNGFGFTRIETPHGH